MVRVKLSVTVRVVRVRVTVRVITAVAPSRSPVQYLGQPLRWHAAPLPLRWHAPTTEVARGYHLHGMLLPVRWPARLPPHPPLP